jgi:hypothetical protein
MKHKIILVLLVVINMCVQGMEKERDDSPTPFKRNRLHTNQNSNNNHKDHQRLASGDTTKISVHLKKQGSASKLEGSLGSRKTSSEIIKIMVGITGGLATTEGSERKPHNSPEQLDALVGTLQHQPITLQGVVGKRATPPSITR